MCFSTFVFLNLFTFFYLFHAYKLTRFLLFLFFFLSRYSRQVVCLIRKKMKFMVLDMVYLRHELDDQPCIYRRPPLMYTIHKIIYNQLNRNCPHRNQISTSKLYIHNSSICRSSKCNSFSNFSMYLLVSKGVYLKRIF